MNLLAPAALLLSLLAVPIVLLYMLKLRRKETPVSSVLLWQQLLRDRQSNTPWQRLRRHLLLFLQLLILAALVFALARPAVPVPSVAAGAAIILLDGSASMNAADGRPTRFAAARQQALDLVDNLAPDSPVTVILAGTQPRLLATSQTDHAAVRQALNDAQPDLGETDWLSAFSLAAGAASYGSGTRPTTVLISDGGLPAEGLPALSGDVQYLPVGESGDNMAIAALAVRSAAGGPQLFASVHNYGSQVKRAILSFYIEEELFEAREIEIDAGMQRSVVLENLPDEPQRYTARLSNLEGADAPLDALPIDDSAYAVYQPPTSGNTLLVTRGNLFLRQLLESLPGMRSFVALPNEDGQLEIPEGDYNLYILDGIIPDPLPEGNLLLLNPPQNALFESGEAVEVTRAPRVNEHPLTRFVDWSNVHILRARKVTLPVWGEALVQAGDGALVFAGETGSRRVAVITFDLHDSDLPLQIAFPVLFSNLLQYLSPTSGLSKVDGGFSTGSAAADSDGLQVRPGESIFIRPADDVSEIEVIDPSGRTTTLQPEEGRSAFSQTGQPGLYTVRYRMDGSPLAEDSFAVNLFSPGESQIQPRETVQVGQANLAASQGSTLGQRELWPWLAALALLVVLLEWWVYQRQQQVQPGKWIEQLRGRLPGRRREVV